MGLDEGVDESSATKCGARRIGRAPSRVQVNAAAALPVARGPGNERFTGLIRRRSTSSTTEARATAYGFAVVRQVTLSRWPNSHGLAASETRKHSSRPGNPRSPPSNTGNARVSAPRTHRRRHTTSRDGPDDLTRLPARRRQTGARPAVQGAGPQTPLHKRSCTRHMNESMPGAAVS